MNGVKEIRNDFLAGYESLSRDHLKTGPLWIQSVKSDARDRFIALGLPTTRLEQWKYTNVAPVARIPFKPAGNGFKGSLADIGVTGIVASEVTRLQFINGHYSAELSITVAGNGLTAGSLAQLIESDDETVRTHLARHVDYKDHSFVALNTSLLDDGAFIQIPSRLVLEEPIYIVFHSEAPSVETFTNPRVLIIAGESSQVAVVELYTGSGKCPYLTNAVTEVVLGENAIVDHYKLQQEADSAYHISTVQVHQSRCSTFHSHSVSVGGLLVRNDVNVVLDGEGDQCTLDGLYVESGEQHVDNHTLIDHAKSNGSSRELYKGILDDKSTGVFNGSVIVRKDAQKTDALQSNKNLLLSEGAEINTKPQLEIFADDVKCSHGATIGQIDQEALFYLRSRGLDSQAARGLLLYAFSNEILDRMKCAPVRSLIAGALSKKVALGSDVSLNSSSEDL
ncbi:MAG TPA: Fe-S cluster assembly protein SufD [Blastocatellia bacterium]